MRLYHSKIKLCAKKSNTKMCKNKRKITCYIFSYFPVFFLAILKTGVSTRR